MAASRSPQRVVVIGAGIGGLTTAALLARAGLDVTVLESHVDPGGCASTFFHKGYRFDAGATLAGGFYPGGPMDLLAKRSGIAAWPAHPSEPAMVAHLPGGLSVTRFGDERRHAEHERVFGVAARPFFEWQERTADALWDLALRQPQWPPQSASDLGGLIPRGLGWLTASLSHMDPRLAADAFQPAVAHLRSAPESLRQFIDGQLLIAAQTTSERANALYAASALDLPRRGVVHLRGGIGAIAETLVQALRRQGGTMLYRHEAMRVVTESGAPVAVETRRHGAFAADLVVANLPPWNIARLMGAVAPRSLQNLPPIPSDAWGAFMIYVGLDGAAVPAEFPLHHQVIAREPLGEGNSVFLSLSPSWDHGRAPVGKRALTISTHTALGPWWHLHDSDPEAYERRKDEYVDRMLQAAETALPGIRDAAELTMPGTPVTFQRFTRREQGWVGGFPQTSLFRTWGPRLAPNMWMVGDSIFPGQSTAAVGLGGMRVADGILAQVGAGAAVTRSHGGRFDRALGRI